jgi:two-component system alkaline phosphatase synthesis response regulator PhoP
VSSLLIIAQETEALAGLCSGLIRDGFACSVISYGNGSVEKIAAHRPDLVMLETDGSSANAGIWELTQMVKQEGSLPIIALVAREKLDGIDGHLEADDFLISPYDAKELVIRIERLLDRTSNIDSGERIKCDGLVIDLAKCEVTVEGKSVELTFREYELLRFLASNRGRVYTRDALLNKVWGYDYYGGDRTVDVHVRRLRSKIEDSHTFIETVRNIGYRFSSDNSTIPRM